MFYILLERVLPASASGVPIEPLGTFGYSSEVPTDSVLRRLERLHLRHARRQGYASRIVDGLHVLTAEGTGEGPPVLLLHGLASSALDYMPLMALLRHHHREVMALDLPGHGFSPLPEGGMKPSVLRERIEPAVAELLTEPSVVFGNSLGGLAAIRVAQAVPENVLRLVLASPGGAPMDSADLTELLNQFRIGSHNDALSFVDRFQGVARARHVFAWGARIRMGRASVQSLVEQIEVHHLLTAEDLAALTLPVLVFWGRRDRVLPGHAVEFFREHLRHGTFLEPEGYGHAPYLDHLKPFVEQCRDFLVGPPLAS